MSNVLDTHNKGIWSVENFLEVEKHFFHLQKWYILHIFNPFCRLIFSINTQKTPPDHFLDCKMQSTCRVSIPLTLFERYDPNKACKDKFWVIVT